MTAALEVLEPGVLTTVQDLGRPHAVAAGVPPGGAMDRFAHSAANLLVGNDPSAATLECTVVGPRLVATAASLVALTGADLAPTVNGDAIDLWSAIVLAEGDELRFGGRRTGARCYVALAGGVAGDRWLGSRSTYLRAGRGGVEGRALVAGDAIVAAGEPARAADPGRTLAPRLRPRYSGQLHAIRGPHAGRLGSEALAALFGAPFTVTPASDRMAYRLAGPPLDAPGGDVVSFAVVMGAVQLPPGGEPILLMADHQTAGGYPVVATVVSASLPSAAQLAPGDRLTFIDTTFEAAVSMRAAQRAALDSLAG